MEKWSNKSDVRLGGSLTPPKNRTPLFSSRMNLNYCEVIQRNLGPLVTRRALKNLSKLSAHHGQ